jgi:hypothetical protein
VAPPICNRRVNRLNRGQDGHLGCLDAEKVEELNGVLQDLRLGGEVGRDVYRRIGDAEQLRVASHLGHEDVAHTPPRQPEPALFVEQRAHQCVGVNVPFHHGIGLASADQLDGLRGRSRIRWRRSDPVVMRLPVEITASALDGLGDADEARLDDPQRMSLPKGLDHQALRGVNYGDPDWFKLPGLADQIAQGTKSPGHRSRLTNCGPVGEHLPNVARDHEFLVCQERLDRDGAVVCAD